MDLSGIEMWESIFHIVPNPQTEDMEFRRYRVLNRITTKPPYTLGFLYQKLDQMIGPGLWEVEIDYPGYTMTIQTPLQNALYEGELIHMINTIKPAHIGWGIQYVEIRTTNIYVGAVPRLGFTEITMGIETPPQGQTPVYLGTVSRRADAFFTEGIQTPPQGTTHVYTGVFGRRGDRTITTITV